MRLDKKILKEQKAKELKRFYRKFDFLRDAIYKLPKIKLDKPRFAGYKRYFILRDDVARRKDVQDFRDILELLNSTIFSRKKEDFVRFDFDDPPFNEKQKLKTLSVKQYDNLRTGLQKYFIKLTRWDWRKKEQRYEFIHPHMFVLKVKHHYITEVPMLNKDMESEIGRMQERINREHLWPKIDKILGVRNHRDDWDISAKKKRLIDIIIEQEIVNYFKG